MAVNIISKIILKRKADGVCVHVTAFGEDYNSQTIISQLSEEFFSSILWHKNDIKSFLSFLIPFMNMVNSTFILIALPIFGIYNRIM